MHSSQQEKVRDIINSRHLAFPVKMAFIHQAVKIAGFHVHSGLMLRALSQRKSLHNWHISAFWILPPQPNTAPHADPQTTQNLLSNTLLPPLPVLSYSTLRRGWNSSGSPCPWEQQWIASTFYRDAVLPLFIVVAGTLEPYRALAAVHWCAGQETAAKGV